MVISKHVLLLRLDRWQSLPKSTLFFAIFSLFLGIFNPEKAGRNPAELANYVDICTSMMVVSIAVWFWLWRAFRSVYKTLTLEEKTCWELSVKEKTQRSNETLWNEIWAIDKTLPQYKFRSTWHVLWLVFWDAFSFKKPGSA